MFAILTVRFAHCVRVATLLSIPWVMPGRGVSGQESPAKNAVISATVHPGGTMRYTANRFGMVKTNVTNNTNADGSVLVVVTPPGGQGLQYARQIDVPAQCGFETAFPIRIDQVASGTHELPYLLFPGGVDTGALTQQRNEELLPTLSANIVSGGVGQAGWISHPNETRESGKWVGGLLRAMRYDQHKNAAMITVMPLELTAVGEALDSLDTLGVNSPELVHDPVACESIRHWLQRGGRLMLFMDQTGPELVETLLGDALPITVIGDTSANTVKLDLNPDFRVDRYPVRTVTREFDEPVHWLRVKFGAGEMLWSVDGWPVAVQAHVGAGTVVVSTISPSVFLRSSSNPDPASSGFTLIESMRPMVFGTCAPRAPSLLAESVISAESTSAVGYQVPSQLSGAMLALIFPILLVIAGVPLVRKAAGQKLIWIVPVLAVLGSVPAVVFGMKTRSVAPGTVIETQIVQAVQGQLTQSANGYVTLYSPAPEEITATAADGSLIENRADAMNRDYRRQVWTADGQSHWENLTQPAGLRTFATRLTQQHQKPLRAVATFDEHGLTGTLLSGDAKSPEDAIVAGLSPDRMTVALNSDGGFHGGSDSVLALGQFMSGSLMSDVQQQRSALMTAVFNAKDRIERFPAVPSLLYWDGSATSPLAIESETARQVRSALVVLPLQLTAPKSGTPITIPAPFIPYRSVATIDGGISSAFDNNRKDWSPQESGSVTRLEFDLPDICVPFKPTSAVAEILIRAGSRNVAVSAGSSGELTQVAALNSPLGSQRIEIPVALIEESCKTGKLMMEIKVSDLDASLKSEDASGEQDDSWTIERLQMTLKGSVGVE